MFTTYILESEKIQKFYIGWTSDIKKRLEKHNDGSGAWTKSGIPWKVVYTKAFSTKREAIQFEKYLKSLKNKHFLATIINAGWRSGISSRA